MEGKIFGEKSSRKMRQIKRLQTRAARRRNNRNDPKATGELGTVFYGKHDRKKVRIK